MRIDIKQEHIDNGNRGCFNSCPIGLAVLEKTGWEVSVFDSWIMNPVTGRGLKILEIDEGLELSKFVSRFDGGIHVGPLSFELSFDKILEGKVVPEGDRDRVCYQVDNDDNDDNGDDGDDDGDDDNGDEDFDSCDSDLDDDSAEFEANAVLQPAC